MLHFLHLVIETAISLTSLCRGHVAGIQVQLIRHCYVFSQNEKQLTYCLASSRYIGIIFPHMIHCRPLGFPIHPTTCEV